MVIQWPSNNSGEKSVTMFQDADILQFAQYNYAHIGNLLYTFPQFDFKFGKYTVIVLEVSSHSVLSTTPNLTLIFSHHEQHRLAHFLMGYRLCSCYKNSTSVNKVILLGRIYCIVRESVLFLYIISRKSYFF